MVDFFCIGAQKAGTTWLMSNLSCHPGVWTPRFIKELHYFDVLHLGYKRNMLAAYKKRGEKLVAKNEKFAAYFEKVIDPALAFTDEWYQYIFSAAPKHKKKGECTPLYCALPTEGVRHVYRLTPNAKIIYMIRHPYDRALSSLRMEMDFKEVGNSDDVAYLFEDPLFAARGSYSENIERWESIFGKDRILFVPFGDVKENPLDVLRAIEAHVGLKEFNEYPRLRDRINKTVRTNKIISEKSEEKLRNMTDPEVEYLIGRFGMEFLLRTK